MVDDREAREVDESDDDAANDKGLKFCER